MAPLVAAAVFLLMLLDGCGADPSPPSPDTAPSAAPDAAPDAAPGQANTWLSVSVNPKKMSALVSERFLSLTMDPMELSQHRKLGPGAVRTLAMARGLSPAYLRLAGSSSDTLRFSRAPGPSGNGNATEADMRALADWCSAAGWHLVLALNAMVRDKDGHDHAWNGLNARDLMELADHEGYGDLVWQLGYDASSLEQAGVGGGQLGADLVRLRALLSEFPRFRDAMLLGPDVVAPLSSRTARDVAHFLQDEARVAAPAPDGVVWQPWPSLPAGSAVSDGRDAVNDPDLVREDVNRLLGRSAARRPLWIAESDEAPPRTFGGAVQWAQRVQLAARVGADAVFRRWHVPGDDHQPTPDFWVSLLHKRLCGRAVLDSRLAGNKSAASVTVQCTSAPLARRGDRPRLLGSFAKLGYERGDVTLLAVNSGPVKAKVAFKLSPNNGHYLTTVHEYILTAPGNDLDSRGALLNGEVLSMNNGGVLPVLTPHVQRLDHDATLDLLPYSVGFFVFPGAHARACESAPGTSQDTAEVQLVPASEDVHVQFHVEGLQDPEPSKSKTKDKLAATNLKVKQGVSKTNDAIPMADPSSLEEYMDLRAFRARRATPAQRFAEEFFDKMAKRNKHLIAAPHAPTGAVLDPEDQPSTIPVAAAYHPDDVEKDPEPLSKPRKLSLKTPKLPKRPPPLRLPHLKRPPLTPPKTPPAHIKPIPKDKAIVASLVDPTRGVSAEESAEEGEPEKDDFPTGAVLVEIGDSDESNTSKEEEGHDYLEEDEDEEEESVEQGGSNKKASWSQDTPPESLLDDNNKDFEQDQYYFAPGEFLPALMRGAERKAPNGVPEGELGELDLLEEPTNGFETTPSPFEPHFEEFMVMQAPKPSPEQEQLAKQRAGEDVERFYQTAALAAKESQMENNNNVLPTDEDLNTDMLIELGKKYLREKKMALTKRGTDQLPVTAGGADALDAEKAMNLLDDEPESNTQQNIRRKRQLSRQTAAPASAAADRLRSRIRASAEERKPPAAPAIRDRLRGLETRPETTLEQRLSERREAARSESSLEKRLSERRERLDSLLERRRAADKERGRAPPSALRRTERVKRGGSDMYLESFGTRDPADAVRPSPVGGDLLTAGHPVNRFRYGHSPRTRQDVRHEVVKETNVVRYVPADDGASSEEGASRELVPSRDRTYNNNAVRRPPSRQPARQPSWQSNRQAVRRRQQVYQPNDNVAAMWAGSPLSPYQHSHHQHGGLDATSETPTEVKTTRIVKTERTYQTTSERNNWDTAKSGKAHIATLESDGLTHHHHGQHQHGGAAEPFGSTDRHQRFEHSGVPVAASWHPHEAVVEDVSRPRHSPTSSIRRQHGHSQTALDSDRGEYQAGRSLPRKVHFAVPQSTYQRGTSPDLEDEAGPLPEFPFHPPAGRKNDVIRFNADHSSPGGLYVFSSQGQSAGQSIATLPPPSPSQQSYQPQTSIPAPPEPSSYQPPQSSQPSLYQPQSPQPPTLQPQAYQPSTYQPQSTQITPAERSPYQPQPDQPSPPQPPPLTPHQPQSPKPAPYKPQTYPLFPPQPSLSQAQSYQPSPPEQSPFPPQPYQPAEHQTSSLRPSGKFQIAAPRVSVAGPSRVSKQVLDSQAWPDLTGVQQSRGSGRNIKQPLLPEADLEAWPDLTGVQQSRPGRTPKQPFLPDADAEAWPDLTGAQQRRTPGRTPKRPLLPDADAEAWPDLTGVQQSQTPGRTPKRPLLPDADAEAWPDLTGAQQSQTPGRTPKRPVLPDADAEAWPDLTGAQQSRARSRTRLQPALPGADSDAWPDLTGAQQPPRQQPRKQQASAGRTALSGGFASFSKFFRPVQEQPAGSAAQGASQWRQVGRTDNLWGQPDVWNPRQPQRSPAPRRKQVPVNQRATLSEGSQEKLLDYNTHILNRKETQSASNVAFASLAPPGGAVESLKVEVQDPAAQRATKGGPSGPPGSRPLPPSGPAPLAAPGPRPRYRRSTSDEPSKKVMLTMMVQDKPDKPASSTTSSGRKEAVDKGAGAVDKTGGAARANSYNSDLVEEVDGSKTMVDMDSLMDDLVKISKVIGSKKVSSPGVASTLTSNPASTASDKQADREEAAADILKLLPRIMLVRGGSGAAA